MTKEMVCVACPIGCNLTVRLKNGEVESVEGNKCKRGYTYAQTEITNPTRMLTSTVKVNNGKAPLVSVKSAIPLPKDDMFSSMKIINQTQVDAPVVIGDIIIKNILNTGVDIIATSNVERI